MRKKTIWKVRHITQYVSLVEEYNFGDAYDSSDTFDTDARRSPLQK